MPESELDPTADDGITHLSPERETEISSLLATLRDPAPVMPADVAARIDDALANEQVARATAAAAPADQTASVTPLQPRATSTGFPRSKTLFATAASIAALALLIGRPWIHPTDSVTATGPTAQATNPGVQQRGAVTPHETLMQVSRHSYHRSSLAQDAAEFVSGQANGSTVSASAAPKQWQPVTQCVKRALSVLGASLTSKVDLGWLDGKPSAIIVTSDASSSNPATQVKVLQEVNGTCTIAASTSLTP
jgi:hypothetical protein